MSDDPIRLLDDEGSAFLRSLMSAGREEEPEPAALRRTLAAVGIGAPIPATASATSGAASSPLVLVAKWLAIGITIGALASSAAYGIAGALHTPPPAVSVAPPLQANPVAPQMPARPATGINDLPDIPPPPAR